MDNGFEFNKIESNNAEQLKQKSYHLQNSIGKFENSADIQSKYEEKNEPKTTTKVEKAKEKSEVLSKILTTFVAVLSATAIGVTSIEGIMPPSTTLMAYFQEVESTNSEIYYSVEIMDSRLKDGKEQYGRDEQYFEIDLSNLYVVLSNDFTNRTEKVEEQCWSGSFENLKENMLYTISVKVGDITIASKTVKTKNNAQTSSDDPSNSSNNGGNNNG